MTHDYKAALIRLDHHLTQSEPQANGKTLTRHGGAYFTDRELVAIRHALKVADKLAQEPSRAILEVGCVSLSDTGVDDANQEDADECFKAMRDQMLKEAE